MIISVEQLEFSDLVVSMLPVLIVIIGVWVELNKRVERIQVHNDNLKEQFIDLKADIREIKQMLIEDLKDKSKHHEN